MYPGLVSKAVGYIRLFRPINSLMMGLAVAVGEFVALGSIPSFNLLALGILTAFLLTASSMVINDCYDLQIDKINEPTRPIPSGVVSLNEAKFLAALLMLLGLATALAISFGALLIAIVAYMFSALYNSKGKKTGFFGNLMVSFCVAVPFIFGSVAAVSKVTSLAASFSLLAFLASAGREVTKGIADIEGDLAKGVKTLAVVRGSKFAAMVASAFYVTAASLSIVPFVLGQAGLLYLAIITTADIGFLRLATAIAKRPTKTNARSAKNEALLWMLVALMGFIASNL